MPFMNDDHREEARLLNAVVEAARGLQAGSASANAVVVRLSALERYTRDHFGREEEAMQKVGFPAYSVHKAEHDRVLAELASEIGIFGKAGDVARLIAYAGRTVPGWFQQHIVTMDMVTARFLGSAAGWP
jgi:hemerythrin